MGGISIWQLLIVALLVIMLFGRGKISELMADVGKGIKSFKKGLADEGNSDDDKKTIAANGDGPIDVTPERSPGVGSPAEQSPENRRPGHSDA